MIEATVKNALVQGCDRVFLVDNDSPDDTVECALGAGAELAESWKSSSYDEPRRVERMTRVMEQVTEAEGAKHTWWLFLDADHFPRGPGGTTVRELLAGIDGRCQVVGARFLNHLPSGRPAYLSGFHPIDFQPLCDVADRTNCDQRSHWQHPLIRSDSDGPPIRPGSGFHVARCPKVLIESRESIWIHHFQYRDEWVTRDRLDALCGSADGAARNDANDERFRTAGRPGLEVSGLTRRYQALDDVYANRWDCVPNFHHLSRPQLGVAPVNWREVTGDDTQGIARWYTEAELAAARRTATERGEWPWPR